MDNSKHYAMAITCGAKRGPKNDDLTFSPASLRDFLKAIAAPVQEPIYQYQMADGSWIDQIKDSYDYNVRHGQATVRIVYTTPPAAPVQEPVATDWERIARVQDAKLRAMCNDPTAFEQLCEIMDRYEALRPTPPAEQRPWVGLTDEEIDSVQRQYIQQMMPGSRHFARAIEAKLKEKNT